VVGRVLLIALGRGVQENDGGQVGYAALNEKTGQNGVGADDFMSWAQVARLNGNKYAQVYGERPQKVGHR
jgi:hypothetical protein